MLFPAAKMMDYIVGIDIHIVVVFFTPAPAPIPHPFYGPIYVWLTPKFPLTNVFINNQPACAVGGTSYSVHIPFGFPTNPLNTPWWKRAFLNVPKVLMITAMTIIVNATIALTMVLLVPPSKTAQGFVKDVTGIEITSVSKTLAGIAASVTKYATSWVSWIQLLMSALPFPLANGAPGIANPTVLVNGAPLATGAPLTSITCADAPFSFIPNAMTLATSNVMVGLSLQQFLMGLATHVAKETVKMGVGKVYSKAAAGSKAKADAKKQKQQDAPKENKHDADSTKIDSKKNQAKSNQQKGSCKP